MPIIRPARNTEREFLHALWEHSVRATHHFLTEEDIACYSSMVRELLGMDLEFWVACDEEANAPKGFMLLDLSPENEWKLEALFIDPNVRRSGIGTVLVRHARILKGRFLLDVNEQNFGARAFYERMGFRVVGRSPLDSTGRPFPLVHMEG